MARISVSDLTVSSRLGVSTRTTGLPSVGWVTLTARIVAVNDCNPWPIIWPSWPVVISCASHEKRIEFDEERSHGTLPGCGRTYDAKCRFKEPSQSNNGEQLIRKHPQYSSVRYSICSAGSLVVKSPVIGSP